MTTPTPHYVDGKKYMWDGKDHEASADAESARAEYQKQNFETIVVEEDGKFHVYTRRVVTEVIVEGEPP